MFKRILLTGASGMVGKNILECPHFNKHRLLTPSSRELNLLEIDAVAKYFDQNDIDLVIHAAGEVGGIQANVKHPINFLVQNTLMGINLINTAHQSGIKDLVNISSSCMYPRNAVNPISEEQLLNGELEPTNEGYALAKITSTRLCEYINREDPSCRYKTVIPCNLYGRYDKFGPNNSHMIPAVIRKLIQARDNKKASVDIWGDGLARREFLYAADLAEFLAYAINNFSDMPQNINVGLGCDYSINEYYQIIADIIGYKGVFENDLSKPTGMQQKLVDISLLKQFGWHHTTSLKDGIQKTVEYYEGVNHE